MRDDKRLLLEQLARHLNCEPEALYFLFVSDADSTCPNTVFDMPGSVRERQMRALRNRQLIDRHASGDAVPPRHWVAAE